MADLREARDRAATADLLELRLDGVTDLDVAGALADRRLPAIVTCRAVWEGGRFDGSEADRLRVLQQAIDLGAEYVDVEWRAEHQQLVRRPGTALVLSHHDFTGVPADLADRVRAMRAVGADVVKVSVMAHALGDCLRLREATAGRIGREVAIAMGPYGAVTRVWPAHFGSAWTYGGTAAPGQTSVAELVHTFRVRETTAATALYAVTGHPLSHSASPAMHNAAFAELGMDAVYVSLPTPDIEEFDRVARALGLVGASVTAPHKAWAYRLAQDADAVSRTTEASNTLRRTADGWTAANFDVDGFLAPLRRREMPLAGRRVVVLGAGGAARTAVYALVSEGAHVEVSARRGDQAASLAASLGATPTTWPPPPGWDLLVNTTPIGTWPHVDAAPIPQESVQGRCVYDLIYNPSVTTLLGWAAAAGADTIDGLEMLVAQAARQFEWWTGRTAPVATMAAAASAFIERHRTRP